MPLVQGPSALLPASLRSLCAQVLPRLRLIPELHKWLVASSLSESLIKLNQHHSVSHPHGIIDPVKELWECLVQGPPLQVLLDLLGTANTTPATLPNSSFDDDLDSRGMTQEEYLSDFIRRVHILELQGRLPCGEIFRVEECISGCATGFAKVLRTIHRLLNCLEATYPGLYELPIEHRKKHGDIIRGFLSDELNYLSDLRMMGSCLSILRTSLSPCPITLECSSVYIERMLAYQTCLVAATQEMCSDYNVNGQWDRVFSLNDSSRYISGIGAYQSYCADYPSMVDFTEGLLCEPSNTSHNSIHRKAVVELSNLLCSPIKRITRYSEELSSLLSVTHPIDNPTSFNTLCTAQLKFQTLSQTILEVLQHVRTAWTVKSMSARVSSWHGLDTDPEQLGTLLIDDHITTGIHDETLECGIECCAFLFEKILILCCISEQRTDSTGAVKAGSTVPLAGAAHKYPIEPWNLGPAARQTTPLHLYCAISMDSIQRVYRPEADSYSLDLIWVYGKATNQTILNFICKEQLEQWVSLLLRVSPPDTVSVSLGFDDLSILEDEVASIQLDNDDPYLEAIGDRRISKPRPWSLVARKEITPASSLWHAKLDDRQLPNSPSILPQLFYGSSEVELSPRSPLSISTRLSPILDYVEAGGEDLHVPPTPPPDSESSGSSNDVIPLLDLTGQITRTEKFPSAHGGYADVWIGEWNYHPQTRKVAVKVLRGKIYDEVREEKMKKRLRREIRVWQKLNHENVIPLYGTCNDFGPYASMVCPWLENGSVRKYIERHGERLKLSHRLRLLCEIASGLAYLHSFQVVHGDLSGTNVLINEHGRACLCDFGLSSVIEEFAGTSYFTSSLGGAVRWAAPELYHFVGEDDQTPHLTTSSDIYSYGSVALEILSGEVPYHYLKSDGQVLIELSRGIRPKRPSSGFVTNAAWGFILECWKDPPVARPSTTDVSLQIRQLHQGSMRYTI